MLARKNALSIPVIAVHTSTIVPRVAGSSSRVGDEQAACGQKKRRHRPAALPKSACSDSEEKEDDDDGSNLSGVGRRSIQLSLHLTLTRNYADTRFATRHPTRDILSDFFLKMCESPGNACSGSAGICSPK